MSSNYQARVGDFLLACFGAEIATDKTERNHRHLEEALELVQALGCTQSEAHQLVDYVFGRPIGEPHQECGGVMVTLAALCRANGLDMAWAGEEELARCWMKIDAIREKQKNKPKHSPLPQAVVHPTDILHGGSDCPSYTSPAEAVATHAPVDGAGGVAACPGGFWETAEEFPGGAGYARCSVCKGTHRSGSQTALNPAAAWPFPPPGMHVVGWLDGDEFIGLPEQARKRPNAVAVYARSAKLTKEEER